MSAASQKQLAPDALLHNLLQAALAAADPARLVPPHLPDPASLPEGGRLVVVGAGKAAGAMARAVEEHWPGPLSGLVVTRYGHGLPCRRIEVVEAAHPVPDPAGEAAAARILEQVRGLTEKDRVLALISGGGSALMAAPAPGVSLAQKRALTRALLRCGADIGEINCVRKHLSAVKGGRLAAAAWPAPVLTLAISDVAGDDPSVIASGPTVADPTTCDDALAVLARHGIEVPPEVAALLQSGALETPKPGDPRLGRSDYRLIGRPQQSLLAAAEAARAAGITPLVLGDRWKGRRRRWPRSWPAWPWPVRARARPWRRPACSSPAARPPSAWRRARPWAGAGATANSFWPWRWPSAAGPASTPWRRTRTASTAPRTTPAPASIRQPWPGPPPPAWTPGAIWPATTPTASSPAWGTCC